MDPKDTRPDESQEPKKTSPSPDDEPTGEIEHQHRKHGYRGYPNNPDIGGGIHTGSGFGGVGSTAEPGSGQGILTDKTREAIEEIDEEDEDTP